MKTRYNMPRILCALIECAVLGESGSAQTSGSIPQDSSHHLNVRYENIIWQRIFPELGERSSEIAILRVDPNTQATQLMIRVPKDFHIPKHWHTGNETHTIINGSFILESDGHREALGPGSFNFMPSRMAHEAWTGPDEGALLFIATDRAWDINWVAGPPKPTDLIGGLRNP
jgi:quercetin dioxygenase-like cupin family protein